MTDASHGRTTRSWLFFWARPRRLRPKVWLEWRQVETALFCVLFPQITAFIYAFLIAFGRPMWGVSTVTTQATVVVTCLATWMIAQFALRPAPGHGTAFVGEPPAVWKLTLVALVGALLCVLGSILVFAVVRALFGTTAAMVNFNLGVRGGTSTSDWIIVATVTVLLVPLFEELIFRKWLFERLAGQGLAAAFPLVSVVAFGMVHVGQSPVKAMTIMLLGALCTWLFLRTRHVFWPFLAHALNNGIAFGLARLGF
jgi:membrane protease YdiL (CAAX protease family)